MILFFNIYVTDRQNTKYNRPNLTAHSRFDIARYCLASYAPLMPLVEKVYFHCELADGFDRPEYYEAMEDWISKIFPEDKLEGDFNRVLGIEAWREFRDRIADVDYKSIYCQGNDDHVYLAPDNRVFKRGLDIIEAESEINSIFMASHWPEYFFNSYAGGYHHRVPGGLLKEGDFAIHEAPNTDSIVVLKKEWFNWYCDQPVNPNLRNYQGGPLNRIEDWHPVNGGPVFPMTRIYTPVTEVMRHYDGYSHVNMPPAPIAPLEVPPGFFDNNIKIRYGYPDRREDCVNVNPSILSLKTIDLIGGTDYHWCLSDIPAFWRSRISEIDICPDVDLESMVAERNQRFKERSNNAHWSFPAEWLDAGLVPLDIDKDYKK